MLEIRSPLAAEGSATSTGVVIKSEPAEELDLFASDWPPMSNNPASLPIGGQGAASGQTAFVSLNTKRAADGQTGVTKRVRFAPVTQYDEGDVEHVCGIHGCPRRWNPSPRATRHAPRTTPRTMPRTTAHHPPSTHRPPPTEPIRRSRGAFRPPARLRCPLSWNHAGICSVQIFPGRTRRVRSKAALNPPPLRKLGEAGPAEPTLVAEPLVLRQRELAPPAAVPPPPAQADAELVAVSRVEGSGEIAARRSSAAFAAAFSCHSSTEAEAPGRLASSTPNPSAPISSTLAESSSTLAESSSTLAESSSTLAESSSTLAEPGRPTDIKEADTATAAAEAVAPETEAAAEAEPGGAAEHSGGGGPGGGGSGGGGPGGGASGFMWEAIVVQDGSGAQQTLFQGATTATALLSTQCSPLTTHHSPLTTHHSPLTTH